MVALRRIFGPCRNPDPLDRDPSGSHNPASKMAAESLPPPSRGGNASIAMSHKGSQQFNVEQHFQKIEKQFEDLHDHLQTRPLSPASQAPPPSRGSSRMTGRNPRHIDLFDALFSSHRSQMQNPSSLSPTSPYNEDIAERNMTKFLQTTPTRKRNGVYSRIISALYQEDVADRNIAKAKGGSRPWSRNTTARSPRVPSGASQHKSPGHRRVGSGRSGVEQVKNDKASRPSSRDELRSRLGSQAAQPMSAREEPRPKSSHHLRPQRSAPNLTAKVGSSQGEPSPGPAAHLGVAPAHKQGDTWSNTPLPESPTLPTPMRRDKAINENTPFRESLLRDEPPSPPPRHSPPVVPRNFPPLNLSGPTSRKNVRDLSINTELAARGQSSQQKISHCAIQPPTPSSCDANQNPSIAQIMNSPLPVGTPTSISPYPPSNQKLAEIMDMFKQASSAPALSPHPTFETLQDAIVREINSHEAFRRVPAPDQGPPFTPPTDGSFDGSANVPRSPGNALNRTVSAKESQISKLMRRGSFRKHKRSLDSRKSISTSLPSKGYEKIFKRAPATPSRRRHTDAPPPSPGFFDTVEPSQSPEGTSDQVTYMDVLLRSANQKRGSPSSKKETEIGVVKNLGHSQSVGTLSSHGLSDGSSAAAPSIYYMRAQTSESSDGRPSLEEDIDDDDDIIQLPSVGLPRLQIQGVDENNVKYTVENTTPTSAYRLMSWPQKSRTFSASSRSDMQQIRGMRSVESY